MHFTEDSAGTDFALKMLLIAIETNIRDKSKLEQAHSCVFGALLIMKENIRTLQRRGQLLIMLIALIIFNHIKSRGKQLHCLIVDSRLFSNSFILGHRSVLFHIGAYLEILSCEIDES